MNLALNQHRLAILLVDNDAVDREKILRLLDTTMLPLQVFEGSCAQDALRLINEHHFSCAILDYRLRDTLGEEFITSIQRHSDTPIPIIMINGEANEPVAVEVMRDGVLDYLPKHNLQSDQLKSALEASFNWAESQRQIKKAQNDWYPQVQPLSQLTWTCRPDGTCDFLSDPWGEFTGVPIAEQLDFGWINQLHPDDQEPTLRAWRETVVTGHNFLINFRLRRFDGEYRWFDSRATPQKDTAGNIVRWLGTNTDIHELKSAKQSTSANEQRFHAAFYYAPLGTVIVALDGLILQSNPALRQLLGYSGDEDLNQRNIKELSHPDDAANEQAQLSLLQTEEVPSIQYETSYLTKDGRVIPALVSAALMYKQEQEPSILLQIYDLSERKRYEQQLIKLAHYDPLTGLGNRAKLNEEIAFLIQKSHRNASPFAVLFGDLDHFKQINDGLGHEAGDNLLKIIARRLYKTLRQEDSVARLGGDEFVILLRDVTSFESVVTVAEKLITKIKKPIRLGTSTVHVGMSFGIALYPTDGDNAPALLRNADSALYDAKAKGRSCYQLYRKELTEYVHNRLLLEADLRRAVNQHEFELFYQPVVALDNGKITLVEALVRWHHPVRGTLLPDEFIPFAQESDLINHIGEWIIYEACAQAAQWNAQNFPIAVAINVSVRQFQQESLVQVISQALQQAQLPASQLIIEITEQMFLENTGNNLRQINELKQLGVKISLDDFGTGYSSLNYVIRFAPHYLKIDRTFINKIGTAKEHDEMAAAIIGLGKIIPMKIVAEGVETEAQKNFLKARGCDLAQGYLFAYPLQKDNLLEFFHEQII